MAEGEKIIKTTFKLLGGEFNWSTKKWYIPEGAMIETFVNYYPMFADKTKIPASFKVVTIVMNSQDDAQKARADEASHRSSAFNATTCSISGDGRDAKNNVLNK